MGWLYAPNTKDESFCDEPLRDVHYFGERGGMQGLPRSSNLENWLDNIKIAYADAEATFLPRESQARVTTGFLKVYNSVKDQVRNLTKEAVVGNEGYSVTFVGHSLGGAIALIAAMDAAFDRTHLNLDNNRLFTFTVGMPRVGNSAFARLVHQSGITTYRHVNKNDI
ncbi:hypothetical protein HK104_008051, partial [Borealophlyctis nickersoniae]